MKKKVKSVSKGGSKNIKLAILALGILLFLIILSKLLGFFSNLSQAFTLSAGPKHEWNGQSSVNIIFAYLNDSQSPRIYLVNVNPTEGTATLLYLPNQIYFSLPKNYGNWELGSVFRLGQESKDKVGYVLLKMSVSKLVGLPIDGMVVQKTSDHPEQLIASWKNNPISMLDYYLQIKTDLNPIGTLRLVTTLSRLRSDKISYINLENSSITESKLLLDSSRVLGLNNTRLDVFLRNNFAEGDILEEGQSIAVFNATTHPGLAQEVARVISNLGGTVIKVANTDITSHESLVVLSKAEKSYTFWRIASSFAPLCLEKACNSHDPEVNNSRAQINVVIGEDYYNLWYRR